MSHRDQVGLVLMVGGGGRESDVEQALRRARQAAARDIVEQVLNLTQIFPRIVLSDDAEWLDTLDGLGLQLECTESDAGFHFGQTLASTIERHSLSACLYMGGGSAPLLSGELVQQIAQSVVSERPVLVTNNLHSSDWAAFSPADALLPLVPWLERDNALPWVWREKTGLSVQVLPRSAATQMDIDTPFDLLALARHPSVQSYLRESLDQLTWPTDHLDATLEVLRREASHVIVAGRVSTWTWRLLEKHTRVWVRVYAEERGMRASGRQARGEVVSLLNDYIDLVGVEQLFHRLARMADAILLDSRVILASRGLWPSDADRFHADLLMAENVSAPFLRSLALAAREAPVPVVMGGHSLVAGGLAVLLEGAGIIPYS